MANAMLNSLVPSMSTKRQIVSVDGVLGAKNFNLERGENIILMDSNTDVIYVKSIDELGKCQLKVYQCTDITDSALSDNCTTISKTDFDRLTKELSDLKEMVKGMNINEHDAGKQQQYKKSSNEVCK